MDYIYVHWLVTLSSNAVKQGTSYLVEFAMNF